MHPPRRGILTPPAAPCIVAAQKAVHARYSRRWPCCSHAGDPDPVQPVCPRRVAVTLRKRSVRQLVSLSGHFGEEQQQQQRCDDTARTCRNPNRNPTGPLCERVSPAPTRPHAGGYGSSSPASARGFIQGITLAGQSRLHVISLTPCPAAGATMLFHVIICESP